MRDGAAGTRQRLSAGVGFGERAGALKRIRKRPVDPGFLKGLGHARVFCGDVETVISPDSLNVQSPAAEEAATGPALSELPLKSHLKPAASMTSRGWCGTANYIRRAMSNATARWSFPRMVGFGARSKRPSGPVRVAHPAHSGIPDDAARIVPALTWCGLTVRSARSGSPTSHGWLQKCPAAWCIVKGMALKRMDNVGIVFDDLKAAVAFFTELGLELEGGQTVEGTWVDETVGLSGVRSEIAMMRTPDGHSRLELAKYHAPAVIASEPRVPPPNTLGMHRVMFAVDDIDEVLGRLRELGAELLGEVAQYEETYRLCYVRGPEGIIIALAQELG